MKAVFWKENGVFVGSLVDYDICSQGETLDEARERLWISVESERIIADEHGGSFEDIPKPPQGFIEHLFDIGSPMEGYEDLDDCRLSEMDLKGMRYMAKYFRTPIDIVEACCYRENIPVPDDGGY